MRKDFLVNTAKHKMYVLKDCVKVRNPKNFGTKYAIKRVLRHN
jgi:hypothetical protein